MIVLTSIHVIKSISLLGSLILVRVLTVSRVIAVQLFDFQQDAFHIAFTKFVEKTLELSLEAELLLSFGGGLLT
jgi:hypothetical protein